ncbi:MAG: hypothetical protein AB7K37_09955 [Cyclobacteriaceae bacterium]
MKKLLLIALVGTVGFGEGWAQEAFHRWRKMNQIRRDKFDLILPQVMRENQIDMWIVMNREGHYDPLYTDMGGDTPPRMGTTFLPIRVVNVLKGPCWVCMDIGWKRRAPMITLVPKKNSRSLLQSGILSELA